MPKLSDADAHKVLQDFVHAQDRLKGKLLDNARMALSNDRQFEQFKKSVKDRASLEKRVFMQNLVESDVVSAEAVKEFN